MSEHDSTCALPALPNVAGVQFRHIPNWLGYCAGDDGSIWSAKAKGGNNRTAGRFATKWRVLPQHINSGGYSCVSLFRDGRNCRIPVCWLILETFVGPRPEGMEACHCPDPTRTNSRLGNLRWDTPSANQLDRRMHGTVTRLPGESNPITTLTEAQVREIIARRIGGESYASIADDYGITPPTVCNICMGKTWSHLEVVRPRKGMYAKRRT